MSAHLHSEFVPGCFRCELGRDEEAAALAEQAVDEARWATCRAHLWRERQARFDRWFVCTECGMEREP